MPLGCSTENEESAHAPETTARTSQDAQPNVATAAAAGIDESSIRTQLARLTGESLAPLEGGAVTIAERGSVDGRRAAAQYMEQSFEEMGIPARIIEFHWGEVPGFNVEATLRGDGARNTCG